MIPYGRQSISEKDIQSVVDVLRSDFLTQGTLVPQFEQAVANKVLAKHAVAVNSGTSALHIACLALGLGKGDWLWTSPNTFVASANCALYCAANVDFVDIDPQSLNISISALEEKLHQAEKKGVLPKIVIPVHFAGQSSDMKSIARLARQYGFSVIEDACHAIGGSYLEQPIGSCQYSDMTVFSFHPVKIITTAEGGMAVTNNQVLADKMALLRSHGISKDAKKMTRQPDGEWDYQQQQLGFNYRMTELQAALGVSQLERLDNFVEKRHFLQQRYDQLLSDLPLVTPTQSAQSYSALHLYPIQLILEKINKTREQIFNTLKANGLGVNVHYIPVHTQPYYQKMGFNRGDFVQAENYYQRAITLPLFPEMTIEQQDYIVSVVTEALQ